jgi:aerobic carbon-monoxide dehydrogenase large subunit
MAAEGFGASIKRKEDYRFLTGKGTYTDDIVRPGQLHAHILRSPFAHAKVTSIDVSEARGAPGVVAVFTGADLVAAKVGGIPCGWQITNKDGTKMKEPAHPALVTDRVRHVGDPVAMVVAATRAQAREAALRIAVEYEELPAVVGMPEAIQPGAPLVWDEAPENTCFDWHIGDAAQTDAAFARAEHVTRLDVVNQRLVANAMEPRAANAEYDRATDMTTLWTTSQNPHLTRLLLGAFVLGIPESKLRVVAPDVGGGFGSKIFHYAEEALVTFATRKLHRPVKWTADRSESFMSDAHGRDHVTRVELALKKDGTFLGLRVHTLANMGAYLSTFAPAIPTWLYGTLLAGCYTTPAIYAETRAIFTNTVPVDAYRGAGRPEATYLLERVVECAARELDLDRTEIRRKNFIPPEAFPYTVPVVLQYDSGNYAATLDMALRDSDWAGFEARRDEARKRGKLRGIGLTTYVEACGIAPSAVAGAIGARAGLYEAGTVRVHPTGSVTVFTGTHSHGQGHETTFAQVIAELLGVPLDQIEVVHGDTASIPFGMGTYGSRSLSVGGSALARAAQKIIAKGKKIAAHLLEAAEADIEFKDGRFSVAGTDRAKTLGEIALAAYVPHNFPIETVEPGLDETAFYDPKNFTFPHGCHVCEVEIDPATGVTQIVRFTVSDDIGRIVNPMIVEGQIHGGVAQGIGQALLEGCVYDPSSGQLMTGSFMSYTMPRAADLPMIKIGMNVTECPHNPLGAKGCGEVGAIGAPAAVINAICDALGVRDIAMPATPERVWKAIQEGGRAS